MLMYIGVDIGGTKILVASGRGSKIKSSLKIGTPKDDVAGLMQIKRMISQVAAEKPITAIGVAAPGPMDLKRGQLLNPPNLTWRNTKITAPLKAHFKVPVALENDANAAALAEATIGAGRGRRVVLYITISTGIGTGLIINRQIYHGAFDTEGGHITIATNGPKCSCGARGHFEAVVSGKAIVEHYGKPAFQITDRRTWDQISRDLATGIGSLISLISPDIVVLGGGVSVHHRHFMKPLQKYLKQASPLYPLPKIVPAKFIETAAVYGSLLLAEQAS